jgi:hypothetical protein
MTLLDVVSKVNHSIWPTRCRPWMASHGKDYAGVASLVMFAAVHVWLIATIGMRLREGRYFTAPARARRVWLLSAPLSSVPI